jgi:hypothetical protein
MHINNSTDIDDYHISLSCLLGMIDQRN